MKVANRLFPSLLLLSFIFTVCPGFSATNTDRIHLQLDTSEAEAVLAILNRQAAHSPLTEADWQRLFATAPYTRLKARESQMHRAFTDEDFKKFVLSPELAQKSSELSRTLEAWKKADLGAAARRVLPYLPVQAVIRAKVYPVIKPQSNSFVFDLANDPTIFLYLDPAVSPQKLENTVAHEMHHIGFSSIESASDTAIQKLPPNRKTAVTWMGAFGEGFAMLAAAGGPDVHPHAASTSEERARWDHDMANFDQDLRTLDRFFVDVIDSKLTEEEATKKAYSFFGVQGPWYTVGYKMAVTIERHFGRATLIDCMQDPRKLLPAYNRAAALGQKDGAPPALWSPELIKAIEPAP